MAEEARTVWLAIRLNNIHFQEGSEEARFSPVDVLGVYDSEEGALARCTSAADFVGPMRVNESLPEDMVYDWPGASWAVERKPDSFRDPLNRKRWQRLYEYGLKQHELFRIMSGEEHPQKSTAIDPPIMF